AFCFGPSVTGSGGELVDQEQASCAIDFYLGGVESLCRCVSDRDAGHAAPPPGPSWWRRIEKREGASRSSPRTARTRPADQVASAAAALSVCRWRQQKGHAPDAGFDLQLYYSFSPCADRHGRAAS